MSSSEMKEKEIVESSAQMAVEAVSNHKTVKSLVLEGYLMGKYEDVVDDATLMLVKKTKWRGVAYGFGRAFPVLSYTVALCYGAYLVSKFELEFDSIVK